MSDHPRSPSVSAAARWTGLVLGGLPALFLLADGIGKLVRPAAVVEATVQLGFPESTLIGLGVVLLASTALYLLPWTSVLGAILLTGYLGGAVAAHVRVGAGPFPVCFPALLGILLWSGLVLRDPRLRALLRSAAEPRPRIPERS